MARMSVPRWLRWAVVLVGSAVLGFIVSRYAPAWLGVVVGLFGAAVPGLLAERYGPRVLEIVAGDAPLRTVIGDDGAFYNDGWFLALPGALPADTPPEGERTANVVRAWFVERGAYAVDASHLRLALEGRSVDTIIIDGMKARVLRRDPPLDGTLITFPSAGENVVRGVAFDLDRDDSTASTPDGGPYFRDYFVTLSRGEIQVFAIEARTTRDAVEWELEVAFTIRGKREVVRLNDGGQPFRTTPKAPNVGSQYLWAWFEQCPRLIADGGETSLDPDV